MKHRSSSDKTSSSHSAANETTSAGKAAPSYQIDDRRSASVMQRKFRNLANGLASANIIQPKRPALNIQSKTKPFNQD
jgi:hypothetical protein